MNEEFKILTRPIAQHTDSFPKERAVMNLPEYSTPTAAPAGSKSEFILQTESLSKYELIDLAYDYRQKAMILGDRLKITPTPEGQEDEIDRLMFEVDMAKTDALIYANRLNQANDAITVLQTVTMAQKQRIDNAIITLQDTGAKDDKQGLIYSLILGAIRILEGKA